MKLFQNPNQKTTQSLKLPQSFRKLRISFWKLPPNCPWRVLQVSRVTKLPDWTTSPLCISAEFSARYFGVLLQSDAPECSSGMIRSCYSRARFRSCLQLKTLNSPNTFTKSVSPSLRDLQEGLFKIILLRGLRLRAPGKCSPPLPTPMATWPRRSIRVMTARAINHQGNN